MKTAVSGGTRARTGTDDAYFEPTRSKQQASFRALRRALDLSLATGSHGLSLMGSGDWNDGMNRLVIRARRERMVDVVSDCHAFRIRNCGTGAGRKRARHPLARAHYPTESCGGSEGWTGRGTGAPISMMHAPGFCRNAECRIDSIAQSWGVISGAAGAERAQRAMNSVQEYLVRYGDLVLLFTPLSTRRAGSGLYQELSPGVRENGGQYTHAAIWSVIAFAMLGEGDEAAELLRILNPIKRTATRTGVYAIRSNRMCWRRISMLSHLTYDEVDGPVHGAAGWFYRAGMEWILGYRSVR